MPDKSQRRFAHPFPLLMGFPWSNGHFLSLTGIEQLFESDDFNDFRDPLTDLLKKLVLFETDIRDAKESSPFFRLLQTPQLTAVGQRLSGLNSLNAELLSKLASTLIEYRLVDVAIYLEMGSYPIGQLEKLGVPIPPKMFFKNMSHWPNLVARGLQLLRECHDDQIPLDALGSEDPTVRIFVSLLHRQDTVEGHKIKSNFECAAAYLSLIFKGVTDLPTTLPKFKTLLVETFGECIPSTRWDPFCESIKSTHAFKLPLQIALAVSPCCLFLPASLMTKDLNRLLLLQMWQGLGGPRPAMLSSMEDIVWRFLFDTALGLYPLNSRFRSAIRELEALDLTCVGYPDCEWFKGDANFRQAVQRNVKGKEPLRPILKRSRGSPSANKVPLRDVGGVVQDDASSSTSTRSSSPAPESDSMQVDNPPPRRPVTRSTAAASSTLTPESFVGASQNIKTSTGAPFCDKKEGKQKPAPLSRQPYQPSTRLSQSRAVSEPPPSLDQVRSEKTVPRKRKSSMRQTSPSKSLKLEIVSQLQVVETIDLTDEMALPPAIDLILNDNVARLSVDGVFWDGREYRNHIAYFHFDAEAQWFGALFRAIAKYHPRTVFSHVDEHHARRLAIGDLQHLLWQSSIVVVGPSNSDYPFSKETLQQFSMLDTPVCVRDFSIPPSQNRVRMGSLTQVLQAVQHRGQALVALDLPTPNGVAPFPALASDAYAWGVTIGHPWCHRRWEMPRGATRWTEVSTAHSYRPLSCAPNGFATHIEVKSGSQLLVVCEPSKNGLHDTVPFALTEQFNRSLVDDWSAVSAQAIHLKAGSTAIIKPHTAFLLLSTSHSIVHYCHFYGVSTLQSSCIGFLHSSLTLDVDNQSALLSQKAAQDLLRRFIHYLHAVYVGGEYDSSANFPHVPDIFQRRGVLDVLSLCNVFELVNVLAGTVSDLDRHHFIHSRKLCRQIVEWLESRFIFKDRHGNRLNLHQDIWMLYLARQVKALIHFSQDGFSVRGGFASNLEDYTANNASLESQLAGLVDWIPDTFAWSSDIDFVVSLRETPGTVLDVNGETYADLEHFTSLSLAM